MLNEDSVHIFVEKFSTGHPDPMYNIEVFFIDFFFTGSSATQIKWYFTINACFMILSYHINNNSSRFFFALQSAQNTNKYEEIPEAG